MSDDYVNAMLRRRLEEQNQRYYSNLYGGALQAQMMQQPTLGPYTMDSAWVTASAMTMGMSGTYTSGLMHSLQKYVPPLPETLTSIPQHPDLLWLDKRVNEMRWKL